VGKSRIGAKAERSPRFAFFPPDFLDRKMLYWIHFFSRPLQLGSRKAFAEWTANWPAAAVQVPGGLLGYVACTSRIIKRG
jgi:hypothetical protein